ncbi:capsule assembly Wzi family protein [Longimicrobium sp.]|uniref:capsule assembly Wzi family protein n=1 Tax=Longimicrobium sp. TaxID=2029185 RepID=UPI003B3A3EBE
MDVEAVVGTPARRAHRNGPAARLAGLLLLALAARGGGLAAQTADAPGADPGAGATEARGGHAPHGDQASPLLPPAHWAVRAAERAQALGIAGDYLPPQDAVERGVVLDALEHAAAAAPARSPRLAALARGWLARFREEFPAYGEDAAGDALLVPANGHLAAGFVDERGRWSPAAGYQVTRGQPQPVPGISTPRLELAAAVRAGRHAAGWVQGRWDEGGADVARWEAVAQAGPLALSAGKQPVSYGWGEGGGVVLSSTLLPRVEARTVRPLRPGGVLRWAGGISAHTFASRLGGPRHPDQPWLWGARVSFQPHGRVSFAVNRASIFGGDEAVTIDKLLGMAVGVIRGTTFENQVLSFEGRWRLPTEAVIPATLYLEWGADDGAGALDELPARVAGIFFPALPGAPEVGAGVEYAHFKVACCGHGPWYLNSSHPGNWARGSRPLGHPLGGEGWEAAAYARADVLDARLRLQLRGFARHRSDESLIPVTGGNLYTPGREGRAAGFTARGAWRLTPHTELRASAFGEAGDGWSERGMDVAVSLFF